MKTTLVILLDPDLKMATLENENPIKSPTTMTNILLADDHAIVRVGTMLVIRELFPDAHIVEAEDIDQVLSSLHDQSFGLLILDINIPGGNSLQMIDVIKLRQPDIKILIFSAYEELVFAMRYLKAGADGYLMKSSTENDLRTAIRAVLNDETYISSAVKQHLLSEVTGKNKRPEDVHNPLYALSNREIEVMQLLIKGLSLADIGAALGIQVPTVGTHKKHIYEKLKVTNMIELTEKAKLFGDTSS